MQLSKNLSLKEATKSTTAMRLGIENEPEEWQVENLRDISENVFQKIRDYFGVPVAVSSGFRSPELNEAIGGSTKSQHCKGFALDLDADVFGRITNAEIFQFVKDNLEFDQMIWEFGTDEEPDWVHISYVCNENRNRILKAYKEDGRTAYSIL